MTMYVLFIVLVAGGPILAVAFAASVLGIESPAMGHPPAFQRITDEELEVLRVTAKEAARRQGARDKSASRPKLAPALTAGTWRNVLGVPLNEHRRSVAHRAYRALARANHPDLSGSNEVMQVINNAWRQAKKELVLK